MMAAKDLRWTGLDTQESFATLKDKAVNRLTKVEVI